MHRVIFVCRMNVCRSPLFAATFRQGLGEEASQWRISSAGTEPSSGSNICQVAAGLAGVDPTSHRARPLRARALRTADLVLVATTKERAAVARLNPAARNKTFTVREAVLLGTPPTTESPTSMGTLAEYVELLHSRRGAVPIPAARKSPFRRTKQNPLDIADVHVEGGRAHKSGLAAAKRDIQILVGQLRKAVSST